MRRPGSAARGEGSTRSAPSARRENRISSRWTHVDVPSSVATQEEEGGSSRGPRKRGQLRGSGRSARWRGARAAERVERTHPPTSEVFSLLRGAAKVSYRADGRARRARAGVWGLGEEWGGERDSLDEHVLEAELALELNRRGHARKACAHDDAVARRRSVCRPSAWTEASGGRRDARRVVALCIGRRGLLESVRDQGLLLRDGHGGLAVAEVSGEREEEQPSQLVGGGDGEVHRPYRRLAGPATTSPSPRPGELGCLRYPAAE